MVCSIKLVFLLSLAVAFSLASSREDNERLDLDHETIAKMLNETKWTFIQHSQVSAKEAAEMKEMLRQLWQEKQDELHRKREEEDVEVTMQLTQLREELRQLKEDGRETQVHSAIDNILSLQGLVIEIQREMSEVRQQQQPAALNTSLERFIQQHHIDLHALKASITEQGHEIKMDINRLQDSLATMNDSLSSHKCQVEAEFHLSDNCTISQCTQGFLQQYQECQVEAEFHLSDNCTISQCTQGFLQQYQGVRASNISFSDLVAKKCVYLERTKKSWNDARANCATLGGDLFVAGDMEGALNYLQETIPNEWLWVGLRDEKWSDGRSVTQQEWYPGENNDGPDACGFLGDWGGNYGLWDYPCYQYGLSLCQRGVKFNK